MILADKHKVIEVLLYCGDRADEDNGVGDTLTLRDDLHIFEAASLGRQRVLRDRGGDRDGMTLGEEDYADDCLEAAYRLIESSATLRREWFGAQ